MLYDSFETEISREDLVTVFSNVSKHHSCLEDGPFI